MNPIAKAGIAIGALGGTGGVAYAITQQFKTIDIATKLSEEKYQLLDNESPEWKQILESYKKTIVDKPDLKFTNFDGTTPTENTETELQKLCDKATKLDSTKDTDRIYDKAKKWCTKPRALTDLLANKGYTMLDTTESGDPDSKDWAEKLKSHESASGALANKKFKDLGLDSSSSSKDQINRGKLRQKCRGLKSKKHYEQEFEKELEQAMLWCSKSSK